MKKQLVSRQLAPAVQSHINKWSTCSLCSLHQSATQKVFFRGKVPCDVLFIGEAPGATEDHLGLPFVDQGGTILDEILEATIDKYNIQRFMSFPLQQRTLLLFNNNQSYKLSYCITNAVCCHPLDNDTPTKEQRQACSPRLAEFVKLCSPKLLVLVGKTADIAAISLMTLLPEMIRSISIAHPGSFFYKEDPELEKQRCIVSINEALRKVFTSISR